MARYFLIKKGTCNSGCAASTVQLVAGDGIEFVENTSDCGDFCCPDITTLTINSIPVGAVWSVFEVVLSEQQATAINTAGLNLTAIAWSYVLNSDGTTSGTWGASYLPFEVALNGQVLSISEYTYVGGIITLTGGTTASAGDILILRKLGV